MFLEFQVHGLAQTQGSKRAFPFKRRDGRLGVAVSDDNPKGKAWKSQVADAAREAMFLAGRVLTAEPVILEMVFVMLRPKSHFGSGRNAAVLKDSAPRFPAGKPDVLKLTRAVEDALTGIAWRDDSQVIHLNSAKVYGTVPCVAVRIKPAVPRLPEAWASGSDIEPAALPG
jgi:crossover junction endodeoxyribonuclease RusA